MEDSTMKLICSECQNEEQEEVRFCSQCGADLFPKDDPSTIKMPTLDLSSTAPTEELPESPMKAVEEAPVNLYVLQTGQFFPLIEKDEFIIGRKSKKQSIIPDVDLSPCGAHTLGVSRLHAIIKVNKGDISIADLDSTNGTRVNNIKIEPHQDHSLNHGDRIHLGRCEILALLRKKESTREFL
jgi:hypothetical protein